MSQNKNIYLIDAYALIYRSYYAFIKNPMMNSDGFNTSVIFGFFNSMEELINKEKPSHLLVAFDPPGGSFRNDLFPLYKANRDATPDDIKKSVPLIKEILEAYNINIIQVNGFEADDVIGTIAKKAVTDDFEVFMVTPDKDYFQLLDKKINIIRPAKGGSISELITINNLNTYFDVKSPHQFLEFLALMGDASDNIPGAPGIGEKTAAKLLDQFGTIENLFNNIDKLKGKVFESINNNQETIKLSKLLCTIVTDIPLEFDLNDCLLKRPDWTRLKPLFEKYNLSTIEKRVYSRLNKPSDIQKTLFDIPDEAIQDHESLYKTIANTKHNYKIIEDENQLKELIDIILNLKEICFDTKTITLKNVDTQLTGISFSWEHHSGYYIPFPSETGKIDNYLTLLTKVLSNPQITKIGQNLKFDINVLKNYGIEIYGNIFDTMLAHYLIQPEQRHNTELLAEKYLKYSPVKQDELIERMGKLSVNIPDSLLKNISETAVEEVDITFQLCIILKKLLSELELESLAQMIEMPLVKVIADMEFTGINLEIPVLKEIGNTLRQDLVIIEKNIYRLANSNFNIQSPKQLGDILFTKLNIESTKKTSKSKQYSTSEEVLLELIDKHPIINEIIEYRTLKKLLNTYVEALPQLVNTKTGRLHTTFNQALTSTGRLSSIEPNLQNIPIRNERGREIRKAFIARDINYVLISADYSQIELRVMAHMSNDTSMISAFGNNEDIHTATAAKIYNIGIDEVNREMRNNAKTANFGIIYGISAFGLSQRLKISRKEASNLIIEYFDKFPGIKRFMDDSIQFARTYGYVKTLFGRRRYLPDINSSNANVRSMSERNAINSPIQGTAADIIKLAMSNLYTKMEINKLNSKMILQVHDELIFDVRKDEINIMKELIKLEMENVVKLKVPLLVEMGSGNNWYEAH